MPSIYYMKAVHHIANKKCKWKRCLGSTYFFSRELLQPSLNRNYPKIGKAPPRFRDKLGHGWFGMYRKQISVYIW